MPLPSISIITPSYQQAPYLSDCLNSVLDQKYPALEYVVMDGGSTDGSVEIIESVSDRLHYWQSEKDQGQYHAIADGFSKSTGEIMGWLNSDDMYFPWTLSLVGRLFAQFPDIEWITSLKPANWNKEGVPIHVGEKHGFCKSYFQKGFNLSTPEYTTRGCIQQESTFWRRRLWEKAGATFDPEFPLAGDFDLWARFFQHANLVGVGSMLAGFRQHGNQRSILERDTYRKEATASLLKNGGTPEKGLVAWIRETGLGSKWPFRVMPSRGWIQPTQTIRWSIDQAQWELKDEWITQ